MPGSVSGCQKFWKVSKNIQKPQNDTGRLGRFRRVEGLETRKVQKSYEEEFCQVGGARCSQYWNYRMYRKEHLLYFNKMHHMIQGSQKEHSHMSGMEHGRNL